MFGLGARRTYRLLVVEDDRLVLAGLADGLEREGFEVMRATTGEEAVRICGESAFDLVIMDVCLPGISGIEAAGRIREMSGTPLFFLSAYDSEDLVRNAVAQGGLGYLVKPVALKQLLISVEAALARAAELKVLQENRQHLAQALRAHRSIGIAIGILMERHRIAADEAFEKLRRHARDERRKLSEIAADLVAAAEKLNLPKL